MSHPAVSCCTQEEAQKGEDVATLAQLVSSRARIQVLSPRPLPSQTVAALFSPNVFFLRFCGLSLVGQPN